MNFLAYVLSPHGTRQNSILYECKHGKFELRNAENVECEPACSKSEIPSDFSVLDQKDFVAPGSALAINRRVVKNY